MIRRRIIVTGRVQGVSYRASARRAALALGVSGWAQNLPDGSVEVIAEGAEQPVHDLIEYLKSGPSLANVESIAVSDEPPCGESGFEIR